MATVGSTVSTQTVLTAVSVFTVSSAVTVRVLFPWASPATTPLQVPFGVVPVSLIGVPFTSMVGSFNAEV